MTKSRPKFMIYIGIAFICFILGLTFIPGFILLAVAPIIALREDRKSDSLIDNIKYIFVIPIVIVMAHLIAATLQGFEINYALLIIYGFATVLPFLLLEISENYAPNKWGVLMLVVYWIALEYLLLKINLELSNYYLANALPIHWVGWNVYTGFLGGTAFVLLGNVLLYHSLFKK